MTSRFAIYQSTAGTDARRNVFGVDIANLGLFRALAAHGGFEELAVFANGIESAQVLAEQVAPPGGSATRITPAEIMNQGLAAQGGALLRGRPDLHDLAWLRRRTVGDRAYSLLGLVHSIAPPTMRQMIAMAAIGPVQPWDAIICTSPAVQTAIGALFDGYGDYLGARFGGAQRPRPHLPLLPLGVDVDETAQAAGRPGRRQALREELGVADGDVLVLWVGRLSFFEKAFPQAMFRAVQEASARGGPRLHLAMVGWFPNGEADEARYRQAADAQAPDIAVSFLDGGDRAQTLELYGAADIFVSLVDNIQETFGLTPLEAMAAGLPVVASDWDGYRYTMRDGVEGFLIPTLGGVPGGLGHGMALRHAIGVDSYQAYVGQVAQHTAVHVGKAAGAIAALAASPELRAKMGAAGRARVASSFAWPVVIGQLNGLLGELAELRGAAAAYPQGPDPRSGEGRPLRRLRGLRQPDDEAGDAPHPAARRGPGRPAALGGRRARPDVRRMARGPRGLRPGPDLSGRDGRGERGADPRPVPRRAQAGRRARPGLDGQARPARLACLIRQACAPGPRAAAPCASRPSGNSRTSGPRRRSWPPGSSTTRRRRPAPASAPRRPGSARSSRRRTW